MRCRTEIHLLTTSIVRSGVSWNSVVLEMKQMMITMRRTNGSSRIGLLRTSISATTMVYLPSIMFLDFINQLKAQITRTHPEILVIEDKNITGSYCLIPETTVLTGKLRQEWFPKLTITYDLDIRLNLPAENYLYSHPVIPHVFCVGVEESEDGNITLGQQTLRNTFLEFDIENNRVGMVVAQCEQLRKKFAPDDPHNPWRLVAIVG